MNMELLPLQMHGKIGFLTLRVHQQKHLEACTTSLYNIRGTLNNNILVIIWLHVFKKMEALVLKLNMEHAFLENRMESYDYWNCSYR